jgi:hypothetical protein
VYFTFALNNKGVLNPYQFTYDTSSYNHYAYRQYDRWGNYKDASLNPNGLNNSEFPYTLQDSLSTNAFSRIGQLTDISLPSGGAIHVTYESDDYAYVQDKRASQMCFLQGVGSSGSNTGLIDADYVYISLPHPVHSRSEMLSKYFEGMDKLYYKVFLDLDRKEHWEFVPGYANISGVPELIDSTVAKVKLERNEGVNPIAIAAWQFLRMNLPKYAYPGSENLENDGSSNVTAQIKALFAAFGSIKELFRDFNKRAEKRKYADLVDLSKSWVRLCAPEKKKLGGGSRVKRVDITDNWLEMSGTTGAKSATYTQLYDYTTTDNKGATISSGVASYEPMLGNDENPFRQPITYKQKQSVSLDNYFYIEQPFCESLFPAASVGYSKVTVKSIGTGDDESVNRTGTVVSEFYTSKDYPTLVKILNIEKKKPINKKWFKLIGGISYDMIGLSQGYSIELNDMHGKPKRTSIYNKSKQNISSVEYYYKSENEFAETKQLANDVAVIDPTGAVSNGTIGMDVETYTDMRQETTDNLGVSAKISGGAGAILFFPLPFIFPGIGVNYDRRSYRASSTIKIINRFAVQYKVKKMQNGSSIETENLVWDAETGNVLLTKTQNEFDDPIYSFAYPAHWAYNGMGQAYQNLGTVLSDFSSSSKGLINNETYANLLVAGDELIDINSSQKYWVINSGTTDGPTDLQKRIIDENGILQQVSAITVKLLRSGRRNMAGASIGIITSLKNPIVNNYLQISDLSKVLDAKATVFNEKWSMPVSGAYNQFVFTSCSFNQSCLDKWIKSAMINPDTTKAPIYSTNSSSPITVGQTITSGYGSSDTSCFPNFSDGKSASQIPFYQYNVIDSGTGGSHYYTIHSGDSAQMGECKIYFDYVGPEFNYWANTSYNQWDLYRGFNPDTHVADLVAGNTDCSYRLYLTQGPIEQPRPGPSPGNFSDGEDIDLLQFHIVCKHNLNGCADPVGLPFNPYFTGILGNWRPQSQYVYQVSRENLVGLAGQAGGTNIRKSGAYSVFNPFWTYEEPRFNSNTINDPRWIAANQVTYFNEKGTEIENKDALNRYSSALFGYLQSLPTAVASNSEHREIAFDGFEDYGFLLDCAFQDTCNNNGHFNFKKALGSSASLSNSEAHSGKSSMALDGTVSVVKPIASSSNSPLFSYDNSGQYILGSNELVKGFTPFREKQYLLSFWLKDTSARNPTTSVQASVNGANLISNLTKWPIVEGWKRVEVPFTLSSIASSFSFELSSAGQQVYIDDIRILPYNGQMKSFVYDPSSQRLMAELDENNFATFYEYDDEGILIRVKKETERGIMTLKETRSSYRKMIQP